ncbi:hypothetical protein [Streptomyces sp. NRRL S-575]|uniref:hypothetical protein n=1 Tax=Streptomyces sp. NRRL S-575 TaxID=1463915 RepID=UPI0004CBAF08|nr:hypothetical protein [Streptomyces sp. NRRL S-575]
MFNSSVRLQAEQERALSRGSLLWDPYLCLRGLPCPSRFHRPARRCPRTPDRCPGVAKAFARSCLTAVAVALLFVMYVFSQGHWI